MMLLNKNCQTNCKSRAINVVGCPPPPPPPPFTMTLKSGSEPLPTPPSSPQNNPLTSWCCPAAVSCSGQTSPSAHNRLLHWPFIRSTSWRILLYMFLLKHLNRKNFLKFTPRERSNSLLRIKEMEFPSYLRGSE